MTLVVPEQAIELVVISCHGGSFIKKLPTEDIQIRYMTDCRSWNPYGSPDSLLNAMKVPSGFKVQHAVV